MMIPPIIGSKMRRKGTRFHIAMPNFCISKFNTCRGSLQYCGKIDFSFILFRVRLRNLSSKMSQTLSSNESIPSQRKKIIVLGSGPNRIGQGIEFDYCCVHGLLAIKEAGYEAIMINCNPETVSTDFDIADKLYFEPVYWEHLWKIIELEQPYGVIVQLGGQTALKLAR